MSSKDPSDAGKRAMSALASKLESTVALWRSRLREETAARSGAPATTIDAARSDLREQLVALEEEATTLQKDLAREAMAAAQWEQRAMTAVENNDDDAARDALERHGLHSEAAAALEAEVTLLHAMQQACRDVLENIHYQAAQASTLDASDA